MRDRLAEFGSDVVVVLVTFTQVDRLAEYSARNDLPFPILIDHDRSAYRSFGLGRGSIARIYGWKSARRYFEIYRSKGLEGMRGPTEDTLQLGGDFVIAPDGTLTYGFWGDGPDDRPPVDDLIDAVHASRTP